MSTPNSKEKAKENEADMAKKTDNTASDMESGPNEGLGMKNHMGHGMEHHAAVFDWHKDHMKKNEHHMHETEHKNTEL